MRTNSTKHRWLRLQQSCTGMIYPAVHGTQKDAPFKAGLILRTGYPLVVIRYRGKHFTGQERGRFFKSVTASWKNMRLLQIYQRILKIKTSLAVAWSQNEIPKQRTTGGPVIVFKDTIKVNIYWGNQRPQANGGHDRLKKKKKKLRKGKKKERNLWSCSFFLQCSLSLMLGSSLVLALPLWFIWMMIATYGLPLGLWPQTLSEIAPSAALLNWPPLGAKWIFHKQRRTPAVFDGPIFSKTNHFSGFELLPGPILFRLCL